MHTHKRRPFFRRLRSAAGQTTTEYVMIAGLMTAAASLVISFVYPDFRCRFQKIVECTLNDYDDCMGVSFNICDARSMIWLAQHPGFVIPSLPPPRPPPPPPATTTFNAPMLDGYNLDWCLTYATSCGTPAADAYCQRIGYARSTSWGQDYVSNLGGSATKVIGDNRICSWGVCRAFTYVTCTRP